MNREDIIRMAREAGFNVEKGYLLRITGIDEDLERFAALVASAEREASVGALSALNNTYELELRNAIANEREACAKLCDDMEEKAEGVECCKWPTPIDCAYAIRARGQA